MLTAYRLRRLARAGMLTVQGYTHGYHDAERWSAGLVRAGRATLVAAGASHRRAVRALARELDRAESRDR